MKRRGRGRRGNEETRTREAGRLAPCPHRREEAMDGLWSVACGLWPVAYGLWSVACDLWYMV